MLALLLFGLMVCWPGQINFVSLHSVFLCHFLVNFIVCNYMSVLDFTLIRVQWLRRMSLRVKPWGEIVVRASKRISDREVEKFVTEHAGWIQKQQSKFEKHKQISPDELLELRLLAKSYLPHRTMELAQDLGFTYLQVVCRHQTSRWGSCSYANSISLNIELMRLPPELRDYIIVHELTHTIHKHHQDAFWEHLERVLPWALKLDREMRKWRIGYDESVWGEKKD